MKLACFASPSRRPAGLTRVSRKYLQSMIVLSLGTETLFCYSATISVQRVQEGTKPKIVMKYTRESKYFADPLSPLSSCHLCLVHDVCTCIFFCLFRLTELCDFMTPVYIVNGVERILVIPIQDFRELQLSPVCSSRTPALWTNCCLPYCSCWWICHWGTVNLLSKLQASVWPVSSSFGSSSSKDWVQSRYTN